jgi:arylsulfatase A-like enzyme
VAPKRKIAGATLIDFAPTLTRLMGIAPPAQATGKILDSALTH